jgi:hypothetical protein
LGKGALKETVGRGSVHTIDHDVEGPALFDNHAKPPATGWYLYTIQGWRVAYKVLQTVSSHATSVCVWCPSNGIT